METVRTGETVYQDKSGRDITEDEYRKMAKKAAAQQTRSKEELSDDQGKNSTGGKA